MAVGGCRDPASGTDHLRPSFRSCATISRRRRRSAAVCNDERAGKDEPARRRRVCHRVRSLCSWWFIFCSGDAFSASTEESEGTCSGASSVPRNSSGKRLRLKLKEVNHEKCNRDQEEQGVRILTPGFFSSWEGGCSPRLVSCPCPPWMGVFLSLEEEDREANDESVCGWFLQSTGGLFY